MDYLASKKTRQIVVGIVLICAILMLFLLPFLVKVPLADVQAAQQIRIDKFYAEGNPSASLISTTQELVGWAWPMWVSFTMLGGLVLFFIAKPLYLGARWAKGLALVCLAMPSMGGAYMSVPYMNFVGGVPIFGLAFVLTGLVGYFAVVLMDKSTLKNKLIDVWVFALLGVTGAEAWSNGHAAHRIIDGHSNKPLLPDGIFLLAPTRNISWIALVLLTLAIYFVATRKMSGYYLALIGGASAGFIGFVTQYVRTATYDYLYQGLMGLAIVVTLLIPVVKARLTTEEKEIV